MTQEEKQVLLRDLCARLPYGVYVRINEIHCLDKNEAITDGFIGGYGKPNMCQEYSLDEIYEFLDEDDDVKLYLRPMSSMTEEEMEEFRMLGGVMSYSPQHNTWAIAAFSPEAYDWLNKKMFDYRGLIEKGLAFEATEGMYKTE